MKKAKGKGTSTGDNTGKPDSARHKPHTITVTDRTWELLRVLGGWEKRSYAVTQATELMALAVVEQGEDRAHALLNVGHPDGREFREAARLRDDLRGMTQLRAWGSPDGDALRADGAAKIVEEAEKQVCAGNAERLAWHAKRLAEVLAGTPGLLTVGVGKVGGRRFPHRFPIASLIVYLSGGVDDGMQIPPEFEGLQVFVSEHVVPEPNGGAQRAGGAGLEVEMESSHFHPGHSGPGGVKRKPPAKLKVPDGARAPDRPPLAEASWGGAK